MASYAQWLLTFHITGRVVCGVWRVACGVRYYVCTAPAVPPLIGMGPKNAVGFATQGAVMRVLEARDSTSATGGGEGALEGRRAAGMGNVMLAGAVAASKPRITPTRRPLFETTLQPSVVRAMCFASQHPARSGAEGKTRCSLASYGRCVLHPSTLRAVCRGQNTLQPSVVRAMCFASQHPASQCAEGKTRPTCRIKTAKPCYIHDCVSGAGAVPGDRANRPYQDSAPGTC